MNAKGAQDTASLNLLRELADELTIVGPRLAIYEYRAFCSELRSGKAFALDLRFGPRDTAPAKPLIAPECLADAWGLPETALPLGRISWTESPERLPATAIWLPDSSDSNLAAILLKFAAEHHRDPFLRPLFLCESFRALPILSRYGFAALQCQAPDLMLLTEALAPRFGLTQLRHAASGERLWPINIG